jgi:uncharacterized protein with HEPN domain
MSFDRERASLLDIVENIDAIISYVGQMSFAAFKSDQRTVDATERCLQRITEATIRIGPERMKAIASEIPFERVRGLGNMLRHEYDHIDLGSIFDTVTDDLPMLRAACARVLQRDNG